MAIQVNAVGPLTRLQQRRTGFQVLIACGGAVLLQFRTPAQAALSRTALCDQQLADVKRRNVTGPITLRRVGMT